MFFVDRGKDNDLKITFNNTISQSEIDRATESFASLQQTSGRDFKAAAVLGSSVDTPTDYETGLKGIQNVMDEAFARGISNEKDEMVVLSHTLSEEEYKDYLKDGNLKDVDLSDAVTIVDHIKMELIKGGTEIKGYTDTLDPKLMDEVKQATDKATSITEMTDGMKRFFVATGKDITIDNLYLARYTSASDSAPRSGQYFMADNTGYLAKKAEPADEAVLADRVRDLFEKEGYPVTEESISDGVWLVKNSLTIDETHLERLKEAESVVLPIPEEQIKDYIDTALFEGKAPKDAIVTPHETIYEEAYRITDEILKMSDAEVHATRVLEEARLKMTSEANLELIKSGYSIDTKDLEAYVEALREIEKTPKYRESLEVVKTEDAIKDIKEMPAAVLGRMITVIPDADLMTIRLEGNKAKENFMAANAEYEKMFTPVRKDLGDSIKKAFSNVDELLNGIDMEVNESNRRAVRILGYNSMEISKENIGKVTELDNKLTHVIKALRPSDTLDLIRKGTSPLSLSVDELDKYLNERESSEQEKMERYSKFLYKLERTDSINETERQQYIDVYRLLHQLEKTGYAAIGSLVKTGRDLTFGNLKEEIKTAKSKGFDVTVDESFGFLVKELESEFEPSKMKVMSLNDMTTLNEAYDAMTADTGDDAAEDAYQTEQFKEFKAGLNASEASVNELLNNADNVTASNLIATESLIYNKSAVFKRVDDIRRKDFRDEAEDLADTFDDKEVTGEKYDTMIDNSKEAVFEKAMDSERYIDVKALMLTHKQLTLAASFARNETYHVPVKIDGEMTDVTLKIVHNDEKEASVAISLETEYLGRVNARLYQNGDRVEGYIACNYRDTVTEMSKVADIFGDGVKAVYSKDADTSAFTGISMKDNSENVSTKDLYRIAKLFLENIG